MRRLGILLAVSASVCVCGAAGVVAQDAAPARAMVVDAVTGVPVANARVTAEPPAPGDVPTLTGAGGEIPGSLGATRELRVSKAGYVAAVLAATTVQAEPRIVKLVRAAAISGHAVAQNGAPAVGAMIRAVPLGAGAPAGEFSATVNDIGEFRIAGLPAGRYRVFAAGAPQGGPSASQTVAVRSGDDVSSIEVTLQLRSRCGFRPTSQRTFRDDTGIVQGRVTATAGYPLDCAAVRLVHDGQPDRVTRTDAAGMFLFPDVVPGEYTVEASHAGHVTASYVREDDRSRAPRRFAVAAQQRVFNINVRLPRRGAIAGTLVDDRGDPVEGVTVRALQLRAADGRRTVTATMSAATDDRGMYRIPALLPGRYVIAAAAETAIASEDAASGYADAYYPGTVYLEDAVAVESQADRDRPAIDFVRLRSHVARVTGRAFDEHGHALAGAVLLAPSQRSGAPALAPRVGTTAADGSFVFANVTPGDYVVQAATSHDVQPSFGVAYVTVADRDPPPLTLTVHRTSTVQGRIVVEGGGPDPHRFRLTAATTDGDRSLLTANGPVMGWNGDGTFRLDGVTGAGRIALLSAPSGWYLKRVTIGGRDVIDEPVEFGVDGASYDDAEVVVASDGASIDGTITDLAEQEGASVLVFATTRDRWFRSSRWVKRTVPDRDGNFAVGGLPPGEYWVVAVDRLDTAETAGEWQDVAVLDTLAASARRVTVGPGERFEAMLRLVHR